MDLRRLISVGAGVTSLLVLVAIASHGRPLSQSGSTPGPTATFFDYVATTLLLAAIGTVVVLVAALRTQKVGRDLPARGRWHVLSSFLALASAALLSWFILHSGFEERMRRLTENLKPGGSQYPAQTLPHGKPAPRRNARIRWDEVAIVAVIVGGVLLYWFAVRRRRLPPLPRLQRRAALARALDESLDDLRGDPDIRRAIVAAYARMEQALATVGVVRAPAEAPFEFLERSLLELDAAGAGARRLTELFERAKFSQHEPGESMRDEAIAALVAVRDDLRPEHAPPVAA